MKGYQLTIGENGDSKKLDIFSNNNKTILNKRNEIERRYMNEIVLENEDTELLSEEEFQREIIADFTWENYGNEPTYINNPVVRYINADGNEITQIYCKFITDEDFYIDGYKWLILKEIDILE